MTRISGNVELATLTGCAAAVLALAVVVNEAPQAAVIRQSQVGDSVTFNKHIAPIIFENCAVCHRPGGPAPLELLSYRDATDVAPLIAAATAARRMPPWQPEPGHGEFVGERRLTAEEITLIQRWVEQGLPEGDPADLPPTPVWSKGWQLGEPDLVVAMPASYTLHGDGPEVFRNFVIPVEGMGTRYVEAIELRPDNPPVVHHAQLMLDRTPASRRLDEKDPEPGFDGMHSIGNAEMPQGFFLGWTPGRLPSRAPEGLAWRLDEGTDIVIQLHLRPTGQLETVSASVGLYFTDTPPTRHATALRLGSDAIDLPAGAKAVTIRDEYVTPVDVDVVGVYPHAHYLGKDLRGYAKLPDGTTRWLIHIPDWDFNWQDVYRLADAIFLPKGSTLVMEYIYDNSAENPRNPSNPPVRVVYGPRSVDEMGDLWVQVSPRNQEDHLTLSRDFARRDLLRRIEGFEQTLRMYPNHTEAHSNLGNLLLRIGRTDEAIKHYRRHLDLNPEDGNAHYALALGLQSQGELVDAINQYREVVRIIPNHIDAFNNLANALLTLGMLEEAVTYYRWALEIDSSYADAHNNLGIALMAQNRTEQAMQHLRTAARLKPNWPAPLNSMAWTLATHADDDIRNPSEAVQLAESAAMLTGAQDPMVLNTLAAAYAAAGQFENAIIAAEEAHTLASAAGATELATEIAALLALFRQGKPYTEPTPEGGAVR